MTPEQIKSEAALYLSSLQDQILPLQESFLADNSLYWIGQSTPEPIPEDGSVGQPDPDVARPGMPSWGDFGATLPFSAPFGVMCNTEKWPDGSMGFKIVALFGWDGGIWMGGIQRKEGSWGELSWDYSKFPG